MATEIDDWTDAQIREKFEEFGCPVGPVTATTRKIMLKRLKTLIQNKGTPASKVQEENTYEEDEPDVAPITRPPRRLGRSALRALNESQMAQESEVNLSPLQKSPSTKTRTPTKDHESNRTRETRTRSPSRKSIGRAADFFTPEIETEEPPPPRKVTPARKIPESERSMPSNLKSFSPSRISSGSYGNYDMIEKRKSLEQSIDESIRESRRSIAVANKAFRSRLLDPSLDAYSPKINDTMYSSQNHDDDDALSDDEDTLASPIRITRGTKPSGFELRSVKKRAFPLSLFLFFLIPITILSSSYALFYSSLPTELPSHKYTVPVCRGSSGDNRGSPCIEEVDRNVVESLFKAFRQGFTDIQFTAPCTTSHNQPLFIDNNSIKEMIINNDNTLSVWLVEKKLPDMKVLLDSNPYLNLRAKTDGVSLVKGPNTFVCFLWSKTVLLSEWIIKIGITSMLGVLMYFGVQWYLASMQKQQDDVCTAIDKIVDMAKTRKFAPFETIGKQLEENGFSEDVIKKALSGAAKDPRLTLETRHNITGFGLSADSLLNGLSQESGRGDDGSDYVIPLSCCLKVRGLFTPVRKILSEEDIKMIVDVILKKSIGNRIVHVVVDRKSPEGIVYLRCLSKGEAGGVFRRLNGTAYEGRMLTVKYILESRYNDKFPDSVSYTRPLRPSA